MSEHAKLSASASHRWIHCPPSAKLCERYQDTSSEYAREGTQAHTLAEYRLKRMLKMPCRNPVSELDLFNAEMDGYVDDYASFVVETLLNLERSGSVPLVLLEQRVDFSKYVRGGFGTADVLIITDEEMHLIDLKYGKGQPVSAHENSQLMLYALGAMSMFGFLYDFSKVVLTIYQPRLENVSTYETSYDALDQWAYEVLQPAAALADSGGGEFSVGDWCMFCRAKNECRARAEHNLELAKYAFEQPPLLEDYEISDILSRADELVSWVSGVKKFAFKAALAGKHWPGMKLVRGRSNRKYADEKAVMEALDAAGCRDAYELKSLTALESQYSKKLVGELIGHLIVKPPGKPVLVPESDNRSEIVIEFFDDLTEEEETEAE